MVVVLYGLAFALVLGGLASLVQGAPFLRMEWGGPLVIAGTVAVVGGALLLGIAFCAGRLKRIERELGNSRNGGARIGEPSLASSAPLLDEGGSSTGRTVVVSPAPGRDGASSGSLPPSVEASRPAERPESTPSSRDEPVEHAVLKSAELIPDPALGPSPPSHDDLFASRTDPASEARDGGIAADEDAAAGPLGPEGPPATVIGTYSSGGNSYVMYSDGSIEAETPTGVFRFNSLDELKEFIAAGGENVPTTP
jgi:hypothetical protein